jgi:uncharacterized membrane protein (DUF106 family)
MDTQGKEGSFLPMFIILAISLVIAFLWDNVGLIKNTAHSVIDPVLMPLFNWNVFWGFTLLVFILTLITTVAQKYLTDQETLREMKKEQKKISDEMKEVKNNPEKMMELQKESMKFMGPMMKLSMRPIVYTGIPFILLFRWFMDYFAAIPDFRFFGFLSWFWFYLLGSLIIGSVLRKVLKVV